MIPVEDKRSSGSQNPWRPTDRDPTPWALFLFGLIGATATTILVGKLCMTAKLIRSQLKSQQNSSWRGEANKRFNQRMQEAYEEEQERVERIRNMQRVFYREAQKHRKSYENRNDHNPGAYQHFQREDWYWRSDTSYNKYQRTDFRDSLGGTGSHLMSHHYTILGLDRMRTKPYSDAEIKEAFRAKAMEHHPDQNQVNKEAAEAKFKEVVLSYEAIQLERKGGKCR